MTRRRYPMLLTALSCAALLAGCGSSSSSSSTSNSTSTPAASTPTSSTGSTSSSNPQIQAAVDECKSIIASESKLPQGAKEKLEGACAKAAKGDTNAVKVAAREVCEEVIDQSPLPSSAKESAKANCKR